MRIQGVVAKRLDERIDLAMIQVVGESAVQVLQRATNLNEIEPI